MKSRTQIAAAVALFAAGALARDEVGAVFVGADFLPNNEYNETSSGVYRLQTVGFAMGVLIPLNLPYLDYHLKIKASTHSIEERGWDWSGTIQRDPSGLYDRHASAVNALLVGKEFRFENSLGMLPQFGLGFQLDALNQDDDSPRGGIVYSGLFTDYSLQVRYRFRHFGVGLMGHFQLCVLPSWEGYEATDRISVSLLAFK